MMSIPKQPLQYKRSLDIEEQIAIPYISPKFTGFSQSPPVLATAFLVVSGENTCDELLRSCEEFQQRSVGVAINLRHCAPILIGVTLETAVELVGIEGRRLTFDFICRDDSDVVARGQHERELVE